MAEQSKPGQHLSPAGAAGGAMTFWDHLDVLRGLILRVALVVVAIAVVAFCFKDALFRIVLAPSRPDFVLYDVLNRLHLRMAPGGDAVDFHVTLINTQLAQQFVVHTKAAIGAGLLLASPYVVAELFRFVLPALYATERRYALRCALGGYAMFLLGLLLSYFLIFPLTFRFLGTYQVSADVVNMITLDSYMNTLLTLSFLLGVVFEIPVVCWLLARLGVLTAAPMRRKRRHAYVAILVVAAVITPTSDIFTLLLVSLPMALLYEAGIFVVVRTAPRCESGGGSPSASS